MPSPRGTVLICLCLDLGGNPGPEWGSLTLGHPGVTAAPWCFGISRSTRGQLIIVHALLSGTPVRHVHFLGSCTVWLPAPLGPGPALADVEECRARRSAGDIRNRAGERMAWHSRRAAFRMASHSRRAACCVASHSRPTARGALPRSPCLRAPPAHQFADGKLMSTED